MEETEPQGTTWSRNGGNKSQSHSSASAMEDRDPELGAPHPGLHLPLPMAGALDMSHGDLLARVDVLRHQQGCATETWQLGSNSPQAFVGASGARREDQVAETKLGTLPSTFRKLLHTDHMPPSKAPPEALADQLRPPSCFRPKTTLPVAVEGLA